MELRSKCCGVAVMNFFQANALLMARGNSPMWYSEDKKYFCRKCTNPTEVEEKKEPKVKKKVAEDWIQGEPYE